MSEIEGPARRRVSFPDGITGSASKGADTMSGRVAEPVALVEGGAVEAVVPDSDEGSSGNSSVGQHVPAGGDHRIAMGEGPFQTEGSGGSSFGPAPPLDINVEFVEPFQKLVHHRSTKIRCPIFSKGLPSDPTPARVRSVDRTHPNERRQRVNPRSKLPARSDDIERLTLHFLHFGSATPSRSCTTPATSPVSRPFFSDPDEAAPTSTVRHQLPTAAGVQEPASAHIIQHLARQMSESVFIPWQPTR
ncbi:hypothetical protein ACLOJK_004381 [Asimina triloba]